MSKARFEWKVGLFVFVGLVLLAGLLLEFSKGLSFGSHNDILLRADNAGSLKVHAQVLMSGVEVGRVSDIRLAPSGKYVTIALRISSGFRIYKDARFAIEQQGFLGDQYIAIVPTKNEGEIYSNGEIAEAEAPFNLQEFTRSASGFVTRIDETLKRLNDALAEVERVVLNPETLTNLSQTVGNLREVSREARVTLDRLDQVIATNGPALSYAATNLVAFSEGMNRFAGSLNTLIETNSPQVHTVLTNLEASTASFKDVMADVQAGKGLAGDLLKNEELAGKMSQIMNNLSITTSNLNRLGLWGIMWKQKGPRTNEPPPKALASPKERDQLR
jgi:phospholipid/cholesterol/gamma-HCH transport system substrate-binding protein